jgi:hypothetical protein
MFNDIYHLKKQVSVISKYFKIDFLYLMPEEFFELLVSENDVFCIYLNNPILYDILTFIILLIIVSGRPIDIQIKDNYVCIINYRAKKNKLKLPIKKIFFQNEIDYIENNDKPEIAILTFNRYRQLERCIKAYLGNLKLFSHDDVKITVFDDSNKDVDKNVEICKSYNVDIITLERKYSYINSLINKLSNSPKHIIDAINYTFGNYNINSSFGRNRNFISFFMKNKSYISLDDDSLPFTLTYKPENIKKAIEYFIKINKKEFQYLKYYLPNNTEKILIPVDFYYKFKYSKISDYQYVKYSGTPDSELIIMFFRQLGIDLNHTKILEYLNEPLFLKDIDTRLFMKEIRRDSRLRGLCVFYPSNTYDLRVTISDNYRIEDLMLGMNNLIVRNNNPLEVNISLYHDKDLNFYIKFEDIIKEFNGATIYSIYYNFMKEIIFDKKLEPVSTLFNIMNKLDVNFFDKQKIDELNKIRKKILNLFEFLSKDFPSMSIFKPKLEYFFSIFDINYLNNEANGIIRNISKSMLMWRELKDIEFNHSL